MNLSLFETEILKRQNKHNDEYRWAYISPLVLIFFKITILLATVIILLYKEKTRIVYV